jgi:hypothetical protein
MKFNNTIFVQQILLCDTQGKTRRHATGVFAVCVGAGFSSLVEKQILH